jgi:hypothetical protein
VDDGVCGGRDEFGIFDNVTKRKAVIAVSLFEQPEYMSVTVDRAAVDIVDLADRVGADPLDEVIFDGVAIRRIANGAETLVTLEG